MAYLLDYKTATAVANQLKSGGKKVVLTHGAFDLLHAGHIAFLKKAKKQGDILIVGVEDDEWISKYKSKNRPIINLNHRLELIQELADVDFVFAHTDHKHSMHNYYGRVYDQIGPSILALGRNFDYKGDIFKQLKGKGSIKCLEIKTRYNRFPTTTGIIDKIRNLPWDAV